MNPNPFAHIAIPVSTQSKIPQTSLSKQALADIFTQPHTTAPRGLRDLALLHLLANGLTVRHPL